MYDKTPNVWSTKFTPVKFFLHNRGLWWLTHLECLQDGGVYDDDIDGGYDNDTDGVYDDDTDGGVHDVDEH